MKYEIISAMALGACLIAVPTQATPVRIGGHLVSIEAMERANQWQDPVGGVYGERVRAAEGQELLLVTLAIQGPGSVKLEGFKAKGLDGQEHRCVIKTIEESRLDAEGKPSTAQHTFKRTLAFVVPKGAAIEAILIQGTSVPLPKTATTIKPGGAAEQPKQEASVVLAGIIDGASPQAASPTPPAPPGPSAAVEIRSTALLDEMPGVAGGTWRPIDPERFGAVVIRVRVARGAEYKTSDFTLGYAQSSRKVRAVCAGVTARIPDGWAINEKGMEWSFYPGGTGTLDGLGLLFVVPKDLAEATLYHKGAPVGAAFPIKRQ